LSQNCAIIVSTVEMLSTVLPLTKRVNIAIAYKSRISGGISSPLSWRSSKSIRNEDYIEIPYYTNSESKFQIDMPDIKLLSNNLKFRTQRNKLIVGWIVDDISTLLFSISRGIESVISNKPIQLLKALNNLHVKNCVNK
jgi:hypothetical protein